MGRSKLGVFDPDIAFYPLVIPITSIEEINFYYMAGPTSNLNGTARLPQGCLLCRLHNGKEAAFFLISIFKLQDKCEEILKALSKQKIFYHKNEKKYWIYKW